MKKLTKFFSSEISNVLLEILIRAVHTLLIVNLVLSIFHKEFKNPWFWGISLFLNYVTIYLRQWKREQDLKDVFCQMLAENRALKEYYAEKEFNK